MEALPQAFLIDTGESRNLIHFYRLFDSLEKIQSGLKDQACAWLVGAGGIHFRHLDADLVLGKGSGGLLVQKPQAMGAPPR